MEGFEGKDHFLPDYRVTAKNLAVSSENKIHDDKVAKEYGYRGGLVPGVSVYAYMTYPVVSLWRTEWLTRGRSHVSLSRPVFDGDRLIIRTKASGHSEEPILDCAAINKDEVTCAACKASLPSRVVPLFNASSFPERPSLAERIPVSWEAIRVGEPLASLFVDTSQPDVRAYAQEHGDVLDCYRGGEGVLHPGFLLHLANKVFSSHFILGPWLHVESVCQNLRKVKLGSLLKVLGVPIEKFEKKGHRFVKLQVLLLSGEEPVQQVIHTAIFQIRRTQ